MQLTVEEIYNRLVNDDKILTKKGRITFSLGDIDIIVRQRDVVGNIMQEWIEGWLRKNGIEYALNDNTQMVLFLPDLIGLDISHTFFFHTFLIVTIPSSDISYPKIRYVTCSIHGF